MAEQKQITIPEGATLSGLAQQYGTTTQELQKLNPSIIDPNKIFAGSQLNLPGSVSLSNLPQTKEGTQQFEQALIEQKRNPQLPSGSLPKPQLFSETNIIQEPFKGVFGPGDIINPQTGQLASKPSPYKVGFEKAVSDGLGEIKTGGEARAVIDNYIPSTGTDEKSLSFLQQDEYFNNLVKTVQDYFDPKNQRASLVDTYKTMLKDSGLEQIDLELVDMKKVIEGSEEDIRTEITKAGGFATESQVLGLTNARNKQLIKNYNTLLDTRNAKSSYLNTLIGLETEDRKAMDAKFESSMNFAFEIEKYKESMQTNAIASLDRVQKATGWQGILSATQNDPYTIRLIEKTYGFQPGGLQLAAQKEVEEKALAKEKEQLDIGLKKAQIEKTLTEIPTEEEKARKTLKEGLDIENIRSQIASRKIQDALDLKKLQPANTEQGRLGHLDTVSAIGELQKSGALENAVGPSILKWFTRAYSPGKTNFIAGVETLIDNMNLDKLVQAKERGATFGALSDNELRMLASAASKIGTWRRKDDAGNVVGYNVKEKDFRTELDRISSLTKRAYILSGYAPKDVGAIETDDGKIWVQNYDGTMTEIYTP